MLGVQVPVWRLGAALVLAFGTSEGWLGAESAGSPVEGEVCELLCRLRLASLVL